MSQAVPSVLVTENVIETVSPTWNAPLAPLAPESERIATWMPGASWPRSTSRLVGPEPPGGPGGPWGPVAPSEPLQPESASSGTRSSAAQNELVRTSAVSWRIFIAVSVGSGVVWSRGLGAPQWWHWMQLVPLSACSNGCPFPWHCLQFIAGLCQPGIGVASAWLGVLLWQTWQFSSSRNGSWQVRQWRSSGAPQEPLWLSGWFWLWQALQDSGSWQAEQLRRSMLAASPWPRRRQYCVWFSGCWTLWQSRQLAALWQVSQRSARTSLLCARMTRPCSRGHWPVWL